MKRFSILSLLAAAALLAACGSATEVGNPTGDTPPTRTVTGVVDTATLSASATVKSLNSLEGTESLPPTEYSVVAIAEGIDIVESPLDDQYRFTLEVRINVTYTWEVRLGSIKIGDFSFAQGTSGYRSGQMRIDAEGDAIDLGQVRWRNGAFYPEYEPVDTPGVNTQGDGGQGGNGQGGGQGGSGS